MLLKFKIFQIIKKNFKKNKNFFLVFIRYLILLIILALGYRILYKTFFPLTIYPTFFLLKIFFENITIQKNFIIYNSKFIEINEACVAVSAYLLLLILNLSLSLDFKKRINTIIFSFFSLLFLNIIRIVFLSFLFFKDFSAFDFTHKFFWIFLSTFFVLVIWFAAVKIYSIKEIPFYSDFKNRLIKIN